MKNSFLEKPNYIRIYGHRGARGDIVENSLEGFRYTFDLGIRAVEFDVVISKDNIPVLFHDYHLNPDMVKDSSNNWISDKNIKIFNSVEKDKNPFLSLFGQNDSKLLIILVYHAKIQNGVVFQRRNYS